MSDLALDAPPHQGRDTPVTVRAVNPILNVSDIAETMSWFAKHGWTVGFEWQNNPADPNSPVDFAAVACDDHEIFLCRNEQGGRGKGSNAATFGPDEREGTKAFGCRSSSTTSMTCTTGV